MSSGNKKPKKSKQQTEEEVALQAFFEQLDAAIQKGAKSNDPTAQEIVKQLREIKSSIEGKKQESDKKSSLDLMSIGKHLLSAARWIRLLYEIFGG